MFKPKFYTKCKSLIKTTKLRVEVLKKKKGSVVKYLKNDIAELLRTDLDYNAYCRAEGLMVEQDMLSCYNMIDQFIGSISTNLSALQKQRECIEECREAVASLIYAAARFSEFPELRDLRTLFTEKYGNSLEPFTSKEFIERHKPETVTKEMKLRLLHDMAKEFSIDWDAKSLEQKLFQPPPSTKENTKEDTYIQKTTGRNNTIEKPKIRENISNENHHNQQSSSDDDLKRKDSSSISVDICSVDEVNSKKPFYSRFLPPPYIKQNVETEEIKISNSLKPSISTKEEKQHKDDIVEEAKPKPKSVRRRNLKPPPVDENVGKENNRTDAEEKKLDELLMNYSKRESNVEPSKVSPYLKPPYLKPPPSHYKKLENVEGVSTPPVRISSMPAEPTTPVETNKIHARHKSLQPEMLAGGKHIHPSLPDYDDLAARIALLRGR